MFKEGISALLSEMSAHLILSQRRKVFEWSDPSLQLIWRNEIQAAEQIDSTPQH